jgi:hypothetical protein
LSLTPEQRRLRASVAAHVQWASEPDRSARTKAARDGLLAKYEREVDPDGKLPPEERRRRAEHLRKAHMARMALASSRARAAKKGGGHAPT